MGDDTEASEDERAVELSAISAIFPELEIDENDPFSASLELAVAPANTFPVAFPSVSECSPPSVLLTPPSSDDTDIDPTKAVSGSAVSTIHHLSYFPPLRLQITLPNGYPEELGPRVHLESGSSWLAKEKLEELESHVYVLWKDGGHNQVVYDYIDHLQQAAEDGFGLVPKDGSALEMKQELEIALLDYDLKMQRAKFERETFDCGVCLEPKKGAVCHRLILCGHVFCVECLQDFYNSCITEGDVSSVKCLAPDCAKQVSQPNSTSRKKRKKKEDRTLDPSELLEIPLLQETVQRYVKLKRKKELESDRRTVFCPRQWCQGVAKSKETEETNMDDSESEDEGNEHKEYDPNDNDDKFPPPSERLAICEDCAFAFCSVCKSGWHGEFARCFPRKQYELTKEERASEDYLKKHSTPCPTCDARCQKTHGCNHMICFQCNTHFCYLCSSWLSADNPYEHFNTPHQLCYQRLWELEQGDGEGVARQIDEARHAPPPPPPAEPLPAAPAEVMEVVFEADPPPPAPNPPQAAAAPEARVQPWEMNGIRINRRAQQGLVRARPVRNQNDGLQRFLQLAVEDHEDEWDSDEMDSDDDGWGEIPIRGEPR